MAVVVANCPRCDSSKITLDVASTTPVGRPEHGWVQSFEAFCICRNCGRSTVFILRVENYDFARAKFGSKPETFDGSLNPYIAEPSRYVALHDMGAKYPPDHVPKAVGDVFFEATTCCVVECWNAAAAMFRKCVDLATGPLLPVEERPGLNAKVRRDLGLRLPWLFDNGVLPEDLRELSTCIREDGNDGAHAGALTKVDALDLMDFTEALLERIFTEPERLRIARERREERRKPPP